MSTNNKNCTCFYSLVCINWFVFLVLDVVIRNNTQRVGLPRTIKQAGEWQLEPKLYHCIKKKYYIVVVIVQICNEKNFEIDIPYVRHYNMFIFGTHFYKTISLFSRRFFKENSVLTYS